MVNKTVTSYASSLNISIETDAFFAVCYKILDQKFWSPQFSDQSYAYAELQFQRGTHHLIATGSQFYLLTDLSKRQLYKPTDSNRTVMIQLKLPSSSADLKIT